jgi:hypothetical protein
MAVFPSKIDGFMYVLVGATVIALVGGVCVVWSAPAPLAHRVGVTAMNLAIAAFMAWTTWGTRYTVAPPSLVIRSGPFRWTVPLAEIRTVTPSRSMLSAPACSLDRLEITFGSRRTLVSPADRAGFLAALAAACPGLVVHGETARRA